MHFTYRGGRQPQPYVSWKGISTNIAVPTFSRPLLPNETAQNGPSFKARPIKHWRKQLNPIEGSGRGRAGISIPSNVPGGAIYLGTDSSECANCGPQTSSNAGSLKSIFSTTKNTVIQSGVKVFNDTSSNIICIACNPENNVIKNANTVIGKKYYSDRKSYLESRCLTYHQRLSGSRVSGNTYILNGTHAWASDASTGSQVRETLDCSKGCDATGDTTTKVTTIYKPSNNQFATQGAVTSSSRLLRLKVNTINKNGDSFRTAFNEAAANAGKYRGNPNAPYFIKSKTNNCRAAVYHRTGNHTMCFTTNTGSIGQVA